MLESQEGLKLVRFDESLDDVVVRLPRISRRVETWSTATAVATPPTAPLLESQEGLKQRQEEGRQDCVPLQAARISRRVETNTETIHMSQSYRAARISRRVETKITAAGFGVGGTGAARISRRVETASPP